MKYYDKKTDNELKEEMSKIFGQICECVDITSEELSNITHHDIETVLKWGEVTNSVFPDAVSLKRLSDQSSVGFGLVIDKYRSPVSQLSVKDKPLVMIVEDDEIMNQLLCQILDETGEYQTLPAWDGKVALHLLNEKAGFLFMENKISCILLDLEMPNLHGLEFLEILRRKERKQLIKRTPMPVAIISALHDEETRKKISDLGGCAYIEKPINPADIRYLVKVMCAGVSKTI